MNHIRQSRQDTLAYDHANRSDDWIIVEYFQASHDSNWGTWPNRISARHWCWYLEDLASLRGLDLQAGLERLYCGP